MVDVMNAIPIDAVCFGNHEADFQLEDVALWEILEHWSMALEPHGGARSADTRAPHNAKSPRAGRPTQW